MELSERKKQILRTVVETYIETAEPVGSKAVQENCGMKVSSATIRNEMAELAALGYLEQPHTSAGRVPTPMGYRVYVNELMERHKLSVEETEAINKGLHSKMQQLDDIIADAGRLVSSLTTYPAYSVSSHSHQLTAKRFELVHVDDMTFIAVIMLSDNTVKNRLMRLAEPLSEAELKRYSMMFNNNFTDKTADMITSQLVQSTENLVGDESGVVVTVAGFLVEILTDVQHTYVTGASHLLSHPEFQDVDKARRVMNYLSDTGEMMKLPMPEEGKNVQITIGPENLAAELKDSSVVVARYNVDENTQGLIGVVGPTRMDYSKVAAALSYVAQAIGLMLSQNDFKFPELTGNIDNEAKET